MWHTIRISEVGAEGCDRELKGTALAHHCTVSLQEAEVPQYTETVCLDDRVVAVHSQCPLHNGYHPQSYL